MVLFSFRSPDCHGKVQLKENCLVENSFRFPSHIWNFLVRNSAEEFHRYFQIRPLSTRMKNIFIRYPDKYILPYTGLKF